MYAYISITLGDLNKCKELLAMGAKVSIADEDGFTPAYIAESKGHKVGMSNLSNFYAFSTCDWSVVTNNSISLVVFCYSLSKIGNCQIA